VQAIVEGTTYFLPVGDIINFDLETERLTKEIENAKKEIEGLTKKLANEKFTSRAPAEVVEENRKRLEEYQQTHDKLSDALGRLEGL
ncbi:MAG: hypothetical protein CMM75_03705, partial [Rhodospirillaceae bacterium]|nr:hypothetical protein [Rhodospirillaceae bacterium]